MTTATKTADYRRTTTKGVRLYGIWTKAPSGGFVEWFTESSDERMGIWFVSPYQDGKGWALIQGFTDTIGPFPTIAAARDAIARCA